MALQIRRGPTADRITKKFAQGELIFDTSINEVFIGDSTDGVNGTLGGRPVTSYTSDQAKDAAAATLTDNTQHTNITFTYNSTTKKLSASVPADAVGITSVEADTSPELGGNLNLNGKNITGTGNISTTGTATFTGKIETAGDIEATGSGRLKGSLVGSVRSGDGTVVIVNNGTNGTDAVFTGNLNGNAATVTNGVVITGTYADPSWITSLAGSKVTDAVLTTGTYADPSWITSLAGSKVTDAVLTTGTYADPSWITSLDGTKVTNAVLTTGSYSNPSWIVSIAGSKVTDAVLTTGSYTNPSWIVSIAGSKITGSVTADLVGNVTGSVYSIGNQLLVDAVNNKVIGPIQGNVLSNAGATIIDASTGRLTGAHIGTFTDTTGKILWSGSTFTGQENENINFVLTGNAQLDVNYAVKCGCVDIVNDPTLAGNGVGQAHLVIESQITSKPAVLLSNSQSSNASYTGNNGTLTFVRSKGLVGEFDGIPVVNGTELASILFTAFTDAAQKNIGASIIVSASGTVSPNILPTKLDIGATDSAGVHATRLSVSSAKVESAAPIKFPNYTTTVRDALVAEVGMVIFNTSTTKLQVCTQSTPSVVWTDLH